MKGQFFSPRVSPRNMQRYASNLQEQLGLLREAATAKNFERISEICHKLRGSAAFYGLQEIEEPCLFLENISQEYFTADILEAVRSMELSAEKIIQRAP